MTTATRRKNVQADAMTDATPSQQLVKAADAAITIETPNGLTITLKKPGVLSQFRLVKMLGASASNTTYVNMVLPITYITAIDGRGVQYPNNEREIEALITRLDDEGVDAVMNAVYSAFGKQNPDEDKAAVKN